MSTARWAGVVMAVGMLAGCQTQKPAPPPAQAQAPSGNYSADEARAQLQRADPRTMVGRVVEVLPDRNLAAVRDLPIGAFAINDPISIVASRSDMQQVALATVVNIIQSDGIVVVRYNGGVRAPQRGDLAVRVLPGPQPLAAPQDAGTTPPPADAPKETPAPPPVAPPVVETHKESPAPASPTPPDATKTTPAPVVPAPKEVPAPPAPADAPKDTPAPPPAPADAPKDAPKDAPAPAPADAPKDAPKEAAKDAPAPTETPAPKPADSATDAPKPADNNK
ncbi:MAG TPA: hypothetical protein VG269_25785 [Tepidisphaeraceae bacterium]|nr:hypothetical protein [Tepidisphaeraceae bacterium]